MENHIKSYKRHLAADRTSCGKATANQFRLFLHAAAYWLLWALQATLPKRSPWRTVQFDTIRLRLIKIAARVDELTHGGDGTPGRDPRTCGGMTPTPPEAVLSTPCPPASS